MKTEIENEIEINTIDETMHGVVGVAIYFFSLSTHRHTVSDASDAIVRMTKSK